MKEALVLGAGNIGRGVIGYLLNKAGYHLKLYDIDFKTIQKIKEQNGYHIFIAEDTVRQVYVDDFDIVSEDDLLGEMEKAELIFCCVYEGAFSDIAQKIAKAIKVRKAQNQGPLNVMLCVNSLNAPNKFSVLVRSSIGDSESLLEYFEDSVGINQVMVLSAGLPVPKDLKQKDDYAVMITAHPHLEIDGKSFKGDKPVIDDIEYVDNADARIKRKVLVGNMRHTMAAFIGSNRHYKYIYEAQMDPKIRPLLLGAFKEAHTAITQAFEFDPSEDKAWVDYMNDKLDQKVEDQITRVIANPARKLGFSERFIAPALLCIEFHILPYYVALGAAYGIKELIASSGQYKTVDQVLIEVCGLDPADDYILYQLIEKHFENIK